MKKLILTLVLLAGVAAASFHVQIKNIITPEKAISKNIKLKVTAGSTYQSKMYAQAAAKLDITIFKVSETETNMVWKQEHPALQLHQFPALSRTFQQSICISGIVDSKERLVVCYTIVYQSRGKDLAIQNAKWIARGRLMDEISITI